MTSLESARRALREAARQDRRVKGMTAEDFRRVRSATAPRNWNQRVPGTEHTLGELVVERMDQLADDQGPTKLKQASPSERDWVGAAGFIERVLAALAGFLAAIAKIFGF